jgi:predicted outer membrane repeat protein
MRNIVAFFLFLCTPLLLFSTDVPGGNVSGTWSAEESPYIIMGDISVMASTSLVIEPGVDIFFSNDTQLDVYGTFSAEGTEEDSIRFGAAADNWNGINLHSGISDTVRFSYCRITQMTGMGIKTNNGNESKFVHCRIQDNTAMTEGALSANSSFICLENCFLTNNTPAALYTYVATPIISYCTFIGRSSVRLLYSSSGASIGHCYFDGMNHDNNRALETSASNSSGINYCEFCNFNSTEGSAVKGSSFYDSFNHCYFHNNSASTNGGAVSVETGFVYNCVFENNYAGQNGGAFYGTGTQTDNVYRNNHADLDGGAIWVQGLASGGRRILFEGNSAGEKGGAIYAQTIGLGLYDVIAWNNNAIEGGFLYNNGPLNYYGQDMQNCLVHHNSANTGGAIYSKSPIHTKNSLFANNLSGDAAVTISANDTIRFTNTAFYSNHGNSQADNIQSGDILQEAKIKLLNCYVDGGQESIHLNENDYLSFVNCTEEDPLFVLPTDVVGNTSLAIHANFHFYNTSSLIDGGTNIQMSTDLDQNPRVLGASVDIGPYEGYVELIPGDFNFDGFVNVTDIEILNDYFGCIIDCPLFDLNNDGVVGSSDVMYWMGLMGP